MGDNETEKRAKLCAYIYGFLNETRMEYYRESLNFEDFCADTLYAMVFVLKEITKEIDDEEDEDDGEGTE